MIDDLNLNFRSGGFHHCTHLWDSYASGRDHCYKLYIVMKGTATLVIDGNQLILRPKSVYLINGFNIERQFCDEFMDVYWIHFTPESLFMNYYLSKFSSFYEWTFEDIRLQESDYSAIPKLFEYPFSEENNFSSNSSLGLICKIASFILSLLSDILVQHSEQICEESFKAFLRLKPAIEFINNNYHTNITLENIAKQVNLNPIYFLKLFKSSFKITPLEYKMEIRLNKACRYLNETDLSIQEISDALGFCNQFYFSKMFKKHFQEIPSKYKIKKQIP